MAPEKYKAKPASQKKAPQKPALSPSQKRRLAEKRREEARRLAAEKAQRAALRRERRKRLFRLSFSLSLVFVAAYWIFVAVSIANRASASDDALPLYLFVEGERKEKEVLPAEEVFFENSVYLPVSKLSEYVAISQFGDHTTRSIMLLSSGEYATFYLGSEEAIINGERVSLKAPSFVKDNVLYLPIDFYAEKMNCFTYSQAVAAYGGDTLTYSGSEAAFVFRPFATQAPVDPATIPVFTPPEGA